VPSSADKLLQKAKNTQSNWTRQEIDRLYRGFGFIIRHGRNHDIVSHSDYSDLRETLPRHRKVKPVYVKQAVRLINTLINRQENRSDE